MKKYNIVQLMAQEELKKCFNKYGIEGTEQKIKEIYNTANMQTLKEYMLKEFYKLIRG